MTDVITALDQVTPTRLTAILQRAGVLSRGRVTVVAARGNPAFNSTVSHLAITYSADAPATAPQAILLKRNLPVEWAQQAGADEVAFYNWMAPIAADLPMLVRCFDAAYFPDSRDSHVLLEDLSLTHVTPLTRDQYLSLQGVPTDEQIAAMVDALARFHAYWWGHPKLPQDAAPLCPWYPNKAGYLERVQRWTGFWDGFSQAVTDWFPSDLHDLYEHAVAHLPSLWDRYLGPRITQVRHLTLTHGDCYFANFLCPRDPQDGMARIIDFQSAGTNFAAFDLVLLLAAFWTPTQRQEGEREVRWLRRYYETLTAWGVRGYSWDDLLTDYRLMLSILLFYPIVDFAGGSSQSYWWPKLQCLSSAYTDWHCDELFT